MNVGGHVSRVALDGDVVAARELVGDGVLDEEVGLLDLGEAVRRVVAQPAHVVAGVVEVVAAAAEGRVVA